MNYKILNTDPVELRNFNEQAENSNGKIKDSYDQIINFKSGNSLLGKTITVNFKNDNRKSSIITNCDDGCSFTWTVPSNLKPC